jgi:hypothetical protein
MAGFSGPEKQQLHSCRLPASIMKFALRVSLPIASADGMRCGRIYDGEALVG